MAGTPTPRFRVADMAAWGRLIKSWATQLDYISQDYPAQPPRAFCVNTSYHQQPPQPQTVTNLDANGKPKAWCLPPMSALAVPRADNSTVTLSGAVAMTVDEFKTRVAAAGVIVTEMPAQYKNVIIVQGSVDTMIFRLPPKDTLQGSEDDLLNGVTYAIPSFYNDLYGGQPPNAMPTCPPDHNGVMQLHANRIGEYTLNNCV
jgi:hypothetical protein